MGQFRSAGGLVLLGGGKLGPQFSCRLLMDFTGWIVCDSRHKNALPTGVWSFSGSRTVPTLGASHPRICGYLRPGKPECSPCPS